MIPLFLKILFWYTVFGVLVCLVMPPILFLVATKRSGRRNIIYLETVSTIYRKPSNPEIVRAVMISLQDDIYDGSSINFIEPNSEIEY